MIKDHSLFLTVAYLEPDFIYILNILWLYIISFYYLFKIIIPALDLV